MIDKLEELNKRYLEVELELSKPETVSDMTLFKKLNKEYKSLGKIVELFSLYKLTLNGIKEAKEILETEKDEEFREIAKKELETLAEKKEREEKKLKVLLIPKDPNDEKNIILEIRAGTGGDEAAIFAGDLLRMYQLYAEKNKWVLNIINGNEGSSGGYKEIVCSVEGEDVYGKLKFEAGTHRVQRVPNTETQGRVHTSAATVAVLPEAEDVELEINTSDIRKDTYRASGAGGQHVNKTESAVRLTHEPTGVVVECQDGRSQHANYDKAMKVLRSKLYELEIKKQNEEIAGQRKSMVGSGDRSDKIRTYNFPQARVTDHRINYTVYNLSEIISGDLFSFTEKLRIAENAEKMKVGSGG
jgi:peptide chain release factor 1|tara:strand:+ start:5230 stop:6303 length:1074 start_codon:yes stop_codon:yes gene_type:complete